MNNIKLVLLNFVRDFTMHNKICNKTIEMARLMYNDELSQIHFSFLVKRNKIYSVGVNQKFRTHPIAAKMVDYRFPCYHSELACIKKFPLPLNLLKEFTLVNIRLNRKRELMLAKPCIGCQELLTIFKPRSIVFSTSKGNFEQL